MFSLREELHRAQLVARSRDRERRVEDGHAHQVELSDDGEAVVRDRGADARDDEVGMGRRAVAQVERRPAPRDDDAKVERVGHRHLVSARAGREDEAARRIERGVSREDEQAHGRPGSTGGYAVGARMQPGDRAITSVGFLDAGWRRLAPGSPGLVEGASRAHTLGRLLAVRGGMARGGSVASPMNGPDPSARGGADLRSFSAFPQPLVPRRAGSSSTIGVRTPPRE